MKRQSINVRSLAEFALESGDLSATMMMADRMQDGMQGHKMLQGGYPPGYKSEVWVTLDAEAEGVPLTVQGRIDGLLMGDVPLIDEIKTTRRDPNRIFENEFPAHWAQAEIYAHMVCEKYGTASAQVRLTYFNLNGTCRQFTHDRSAEELRYAFEGYAAPYARWLKSVAEWQGVSLPSLADLKFPFEEYRDGQMDMAEQIYASIGEGRAALIQAPTGIGKTAAALFPCVKALGEGKISRIFYLTARTTTRAVAEATIEKMRDRGLRIRSLTLTAKDKVCLYPGERCSPELCPRARGYFDKRRDALTEALQMERLTPDAISALADRHELCPFELSLDLSELSDVVICDYNHAFDPKVKLKRFFLDKGDHALLVDEAHNLVGRASDMLSATLSLRQMGGLAREVTRALDSGHALALTLSALCGALTELREQHDQPVMETEPPQALGEAALRFTHAAQDLLMEPIEGLVDGYFAALDYLRAQDSYDEHYRTLIQPDERGVAVKLWCYDASEYLAECYKKVRGCALFSATLTPMHYYARVLGLSERRGDAVLDLPSPFPPENLLVLQLPVGTRFRQREQTACQIASAILAMCRAKKGNYLACFPSHAYLNLLRPILESSGEARVICQRGAMSERERAQFLASFQPSPERSMLALIAMGGVFSEGIDLPGELLLGAAIVGVGMPGLSFERECLAQLYGEFDEEGYHYAYTYPGVERVLQAAGRVIRTEEDRGVVLLLDDRFQSELYQEILPPHWQVQRLPEPREIGPKLNAYWTGNI